MELFSSINKNLLVILFMILPFSVYSTTYIKNIRIDADDNAEPGDDDTTFWFSGTARYDLESDQDSVDIHIYFEYVPFGVGRAFNHELERGYNHFICIDSLSSGDIGMVAPGDNHEIKWRFKTRNGDNQCRIKIGRLNGLYTPISSYNSSHGAHARMITNKEYSYNNMGLKSENKITYNSNRDSGFTSTSVDIPLYTKYGQLIKSDESSDKPEKLKRYNDRHLVVFDREGWGATLHYVFGAVYDSERRIIERYSLSPDHVDFTEEDRETFYPPDYILEYDDQDRYVLRKQYKGGLSCKDCPDYNFAGYEAYRRYFSSPDRKIPDSTVISCVDTNEDDQKHRSIITNETITINGEVKHDSTHEYNMYTGSPGTCCENTGDTIERITNYEYDSHGNLTLKTTYERSSLDSSFDTAYKCEERIYDSKGRVLEYYKGCGDDRGMYRKYEYDTDGNIVKEYRIADTTVYEYNRHGARIRRYTTSGDTGIVEWNLFDLDTLPEVNYEK